MGKHLKIFQNISEYNTFKNSQDYIEPHVSVIPNSPGVIYNDPEWKYRNMPLTMEIIDAGSGTCKLGTADGESGFTLFRDIDLWYSINGGPWTQYGSEYEYFDNPNYYWYQGFEIHTGDIVQWKGDNPMNQYGQYPIAPGGELNFSCYGQVKIYGNAASIITSTGYASMTEYDCDPSFWIGDGVSFWNDYGYIFRNCVYNDWEHEISEYPDSTHLVYPSRDYAKEPLTFSISNGWVCIGVCDGEGVRYVPSNLYYKFDYESEWHQYNSLNGVQLYSGDRLQFKGDIQHIGNWSFCFSIMDSSSDNITCSICGNPLSIFDSDDFATLSDFPNGSSDFYAIEEQLFTRCGINYPHLKVPFDLLNYSIAT